MPLYAQCQSCREQTDVTMLNDNDLCPACTELVRPAPPARERLEKWLCTAIIAIYDFIFRTKPTPHTNNWTDFHRH